jgi:hypothetical protein
MPFSLHSKVCFYFFVDSEVYFFVEHMERNQAFTGEIINADDIVAFINAPQNALLLKRARQEYDNLFRGVSRPRARMTVLQVHTTRLN